MNKAYEICKKDIKKQSNYNRGFYTNFFLGWIHCLFDCDLITEEEGIELEKLLMNEKSKNIIPKEKKIKKIGGGIKIMVNLNHRRCRICGKFIKYGWICNKCDETIRGL